MKEMMTLREQVFALTDKDLARLVMVAAQALDDQNWMPEIADLCNIPCDELAEWSAQTVWGDSVKPGLQYAAAVALGWFPEPESI